MRRGRISAKLLRGFVLSILLTGTCGHARAATPDTDFATRCSAPGVVKCIGFDNTTNDIVPNGNLWPDGNGVFRGSLDTTTKASGAGALRFTLPPPPHAGANIAGRWSPASNNALGRLFGQNSTFYVQFRQRFSPEMLNNTWNSTWKTALFHHNQLTCGSIELTTVNSYLSGRPIMYTQCGARGLYTNNGIPPYLLQQGDYNCAYGNTNSTDCYYFTPNEWITFYYQITIGTWDQPNSTIKAWVARDGWTGYKQWVNMPNFTLSCNTDPCSQSPGRDQGYNNITLTPYMTGLSSTSGLAGVTAYTWYDELIVSTQPIAMPGTTAPQLPPASPTGLIVN